MFRAADPEVAKFGRNLSRTISYLDLQTTKLSYIHLRDCQMASMGIIMGTSQRLEISIRDISNLLNAVPNLGPLTRGKELCFSRASVAVGPRTLNSPLGSECRCLYGESSLFAEQLTRPIAFSLVLRRRSALVRLPLS